jgi:drug/metabolite transporter (DMT)-like permease
MAGMRIFFARPPAGAARAEGAPRSGIGNCAACHIPPDFTDFRFHNTGMSLNLLRPRYRGRILQEWRQNRTLVILSGPVMLGSFLSFRYALQMAPMSYAVPARQVSLLIGVLIGILFLGETCGRFRVLATSLILAGVLLVRIG